MTTTTAASTEADPAAADAGVLAKAQALRLQRVWLSGAVYTFCVLLMVLFDWLGYIQLGSKALFGLGVSVAVMTAVFDWWVRSGLNLRLRDPSLTMEQILAATVWHLLPMYWIPTLRAEISLIYLSVFFFGCFRLKRQQFLVVSVLAVLGNLALVWLDILYHTAGVTVHQELIRIFLYTFTLAIVSILGGAIYDMRQQLRQQHVALKLANDRISQQAALDALTGIHNRRFLMEALQREEARARRRGSQFCVVMADLDHFKSINDRYGHLAGDAVLRASAELFSQQLRTADWLAHGGDEVVARFGGEEFAILLPDTELEGARLCAERLRQALRNHRVPALPEQQRLTGSFGVAQFRHTEQLHDLLTRADQALYEAKHGGRDRVVVAA